MCRSCIVVVDAARARLFTFGRVTGGVDTRDELVEQTDLVNPQRRGRPGEHSDTLSQLDDRFARMVLAALRELIDEHSTLRAVICATPRMLAKLRASMPGIVPSSVAIDEVPRNLLELDLPDLRAALAAHSVLPPRAPAPTCGARS